MAVSIFNKIGFIGICLTYYYWLLWLISSEEGDDEAFSDSIYAIYSIVWIAWASFFYFWGILSLFFAACCASKKPKKSASMPMTSPQTQVYAQPPVVPQQQLAGGYSVLAVIAVDSAQSGPTDSLVPIDNASNEILEGEIQYYPNPLVHSSHV
ncbi:hypothetical protein ADUPG1_006008 [Aduncisulcus paluster]|uniref:Transmembrane protein n=1 Tax=Aduncisulcus paluster TaxID=2918883 RepID=A0ABQ5KGG9_9EUKA|nr:hypothetical protein ADUPG1_006008 [Aduncisulcus paluster]